MTKPAYSFVIPVHNEQEVLATLYGRLVATLGRLEGSAEIVFVNDGSTDASLAILKSIRETDDRVCIVSLSRNFGHQIAITAGLAYVRGQAVAILDADLQDPPELLPALFSRLADGPDVVYGVRQKRKEGVVKRLAYFVFYRLLRSVATTDIPVDSGDFCVMSRRMVDHLNRLPESDRFVRGLRAWLGFRQLGVVYERDARFAGKPKYTFAKLIKLSLDGLFSFSLAPLRLVFVVALMVVLAGLITGAVTVWRLLVGADVPGYAWIGALLLLLCGIQLLSLAVVGEYIGMIVHQTKARPLFVVDELIGFE